MIHPAPPGSAAPDMVWVSDAEMTEGAILRRIAAFVVDGIILLILCKALAVGFFVFGLFTLGLGMPLLGLIPLAPAIYTWLSLLSPLSATPGQALLGLAARRNEDLGPPGAFAALIFVLGYILSLMLLGLPTLLALFNSRRRTLHDIASGLVLVRAQALTRATGFWNMPAGGSPRA